MVADGYLESGSLMYGAVRSVSASRARVEECSLTAERWWVLRESDKVGRAPTYPVFLFLEELQTKHDISFCSIAKTNEARHCQSHRILQLDLKLLTFN